MQVIIITTYHSHLTAIASADDYDTLVVCVVLRCTKRPVCKSTRLLEIESHLNWHFSVHFFCYVQASVKGRAWQQGPWACQLQRDIPRNNLPAVSSRQTRRKNLRLRWGKQNSLYVEEDATDVCSPAFLGADTCFLGTGWFLTLSTLCIIWTLDVLKLQH